VDAGSIKAQLPIVYVLDRYGIAVEDGGDGRWAAVCPFHDDADPSLDVFGERLERWGCFPCGAKGDVFDLIERLAWPEGGPAFADVRRYALVLLDDLGRSDWSGPTVGTSKAFDSSRARAEVARSSLRDLGPVRQFLLRKHSQGELRGIEDPAWLQETFGIRSRGDEIILPYWSRAGELVTYKHRTALTKALSPPGRGQFAQTLYAEWRDSDESRPVLLCEGESDVWAATAALDASWAVLGVPTGVGAHPTQAVTLAGRHVTIAFDGDTAGARGEDRWAEALQAYGVTVDYRFVKAGQDLASLDPSELRSLVNG
jgi:hypothetical protein